MKKQLSNDELLNLANVLNDIVAKGTGSVMFKYSIIRNAKLIGDAVSTLNDLKKPTEEFDAYQKELYALAVKYCEAEDGGLILYSDNSFLNKLPKGSNQGVPKPVDAVSKVEHEKALVKLREYHKEVIEVNAKKFSEFNKLLLEKVDVELYELKLRDLDGEHWLEFKHVVALDLLIEEKK